METSATDSGLKPIGPKPDDPVSEQALAWERLLPERSLLNALGGVRLLEVDPEAGRVQAAFVCRSEFCHSGGTTAQGGFVTGWMDFAMAFAVIARSGAQSNIATLDMTVSFLERVSPGEVIARGQVLRWGGSIVFLEASLVQGGRLVARASCSGKRVPLPTGEGQPVPSEPSPGRGTIAP
jgi:acyl-coenzyme A thioesterase PaaI-like protein